MTKREMKGNTLSNFAIVIGIDAYANPKWNLKSAVNDALSFTEWVLDSGGVPEENLHLLLSPTKKKVTPLPYQDANRNNIVETLYKFQDGLGEDGNRLYFYFAGHGTSLPYSRYGELQPTVIIPSDTQSYWRDTHLLIGFSEIFPLLINVHPPEQFFFIDACRGFDLGEEYRQPIASSVGPRIPLPSKPGLPSTQYILYATAPGRRAWSQELKGRGIFLQALLEGLQGKGDAKSWSARDKHFEVTFQRLGVYVASRIRSRIPRKLQQLQLPLQETRGETGDIVLTSFSKDHFDQIPIIVRVKPRKAHSTCKIEALQYVLAQGKYASVATEGPPAPFPCVFKLIPGEYSIYARSKGYQPRNKSIPGGLYEGKELEIKLEPVIESTKPIDSLDQLTKKGTLKVTTADPHIVVLVWNDQRQLIDHGSRSLSIELAPGYYYVQLAIPEEPDEQQTVEILPGQITEIKLDPPPPRINQHNLEMLDGIGIHVDHEGLMHASEEFVPLASPTMVSILNFGAWAEIWPGAHWGHRLRNMGIGSQYDFQKTGPGILLLIGVDGYKTEPNEIIDFLHSGQFELSDQSAIRTDLGTLDILRNFYAAGQRYLPISPGSYVLELNLPDFARTHYTLTILPERITAFIAVINAESEVVVQQSMIPLYPEYFEYEPKQLAYLDIAQRYYSNAQEIIEYEKLVQLLQGKWIDPLFGCIAGYSLILSGKQDRFEQKAKKNMLEFFGVLPDSHILAGLCEPDKKREHYEQALSNGLPVFAQGFRTLSEWFMQNNGELPLIMEKPSKTLLTTSPWTAWVPFG